MEGFAAVMAHVDGLRAAGNADAARRLCRRLLCLLPEAAGAWAAAAELETAPEKQARLLSRATAADPAGAGGDATLRSRLAKAVAATGDAAAARRHYERLVALTPGDVHAYFALAFNRHGVQDVGGGVEPFFRAAVLHPYSAQTQINAGSALFDAGRWRAATPFFERTLAVAPDHGYALFQAARCRRRLADPAAALRLLNRARRVHAPRYDYEVEAAYVLKETGLWPDASALSRRLIAQAPEQYDGWFCSGAALEGQGDADGALRAYDRAARLNPAFGEAYTRRAVVMLRRRLGPPPARRNAATAESKRLGGTLLGVNGRFGNQVLQYGFLRAYAAAHELTLETPDWIGRDLFDADDAPTGAPLPRIQETETDFMASLNAPKGDAELAGCDVIGFFCGDAGPMAPHRAAFRAAFKPGDRVAAQLDAWEAAVRAKGDTVIALHLRRGDFGWGRFWIAPERWYRDWLERVWPHLKNPVLYLATDEPSLVAAFADYAPTTAADLGPPLPGAEFFTDFHILRCADLTAISNSSFSFSAAMLNEKAWLHVRPDRNIAGLRPFDPWGSPVLLD